MESLLGSLFGGDTDDERRAKADDFVNRVESGNPTEGFSTEEALTSFSQVANNLSPRELEDATAQALERFSPEQRREFSQLLQGSAGGGAATDDPHQIAQLTSQLQSQSPDGLLGLLGGGGGLESIIGGLMGGGGAPSGGGGGLVSDLLGGLFGGGKKDQGGSSPAQAGGIDLGNPIVQAILAAIAAIAMKKFMGGRDQPTAPAPGGGNQPSGGGLTGGGWQPKQASSEPAQGTQPTQGGWQPKTASQQLDPADAKQAQKGGLKGAESKDA